MNAEDSGALRFLLDEEIYLLGADKPLFSGSSDGPESDVQAPVPEFPPGGGKGKNLLVLVSYPEEPLMAGEHLAALQNVLNRLGLSLEEAAIVNIAGPSGKGLPELLALFEPRAIVIFGAEACPEGVSPRANTVERLRGIPALMTFSFAEMMSDTTKKKLFWEQMKTL